MPSSDFVASATIQENINNINNAIKELSDILGGDFVSNKKIQERKKRELTPEEKEELEILSKKRDELSIKLSEAKKEKEKSREEYEKMLELIRREGKISYALEQIGSCRVIPIAKIISDL